MSIKRIVVEIEPEAENFFDHPVFRMSVTVDGKAFESVRILTHPDDALVPEYSFRYLVRRATEEIVRAAWPSN